MMGAQLRLVCSCAAGILAFCKNVFGIIPVIDLVTFMQGVHNIAGESARPHFLWACAKPDWFLKR